MKQKVLSLCFPTYNRGWCMKEQIERLLTCPKEVLDKIEIIISDNCSTDDTQQIVENALSKGFECQYIRNSENLGMDGNFVSCFKKARGRYVWLLGDDDTIIIDSLVKIVNILDVPQEYGLLHINQKNDIIGDIIYVSDREQMMKYASYYITFISANIVNTKYVPLIDFEKYMGTWFTLMPLYLTALLTEHMNVILNNRTFDEAKDYVRNGGYNYFSVFVINYLSILAEFITNSELYLWLKKDIWSFVWPHTKQLLIKKEVGNYTTDSGWKILLTNYGMTWYFWKDLIMYLSSYILRKFKLLF